MSEETPQPPPLITHHPSLITFHYIPPGPEEQRAFLMQLLGTVLTLGIVAALSFWTHDTSAKAVLWGGALAAIWMLARGAWSLEKKAQRAQHAEIGIGADGLHITDAKAQSTIIKWQDISECQVIGGRLRVEWPDGKISIGAREIQDGMTLVRRVTKMWAEHTRGDKPSPPSNFIPLSPR